MKHFPKKPNGFTLVELLVVISIIAILAGLTLSTLSYAQNQAARSRAKAEIQGMSLAIESYKIDNGDYPRDLAANSTDNFYLIANSDPKLVTVNATTASPAAYMMAASVALYKELSGDTNLNRGKPTQKVYFTFRPNMLYPKAAAGSNATVTALLDPFRNIYGYSTAGSKAVPVAGQGFNPTFDLWSTADFKQTGATTSNTWITNW